MPANVMPFGVSALSTVVDHPLAALDFAAAVKTGLVAADEFLDDVKQGHKSFGDIPYVTDLPKKPEAEPGIRRDINPRAYALSLIRHQL